VRQRERSCEYLLEKRESEDEKINQFILSCASLCKEATLEKMFYFSTHILRFIVLFI